MAATITAAIAEGSDRGVRESDVLIYSIGVFGGGTRGRGRRRGLLGKISEQTGGRLFEATPVELPDIAKKIGSSCATATFWDIRRRTRRATGVPHITVQVVPPRGLPKLSAHWRLGYNAPIE